MARAHLAVDVELANSFLAAQSEPAVRWIAATVKGEAVCLLKTGSGAADAAAAFGELATGVPLAKDEPCFVVLAREAPGAATRKWQLVCWVPDAAAPRLKMLYSSSREDLKTSLGAGFFASAKDYCANDAADLDWAHVAAAEAGGGAPLTAAELFRKEEAAAEAATDRRASVGMAAVPFHPTPDARAALEAVASGAASLVEVVVGAGETLELAQPPSTDASSVKDSLSALDAPRFVVVKREAKTLFVYYCPDAAPIKAKMTYSTAKATFAALLAEAGVADATTVEVRDAADLDADVAAAAAVVADDRTMTHAANTKPARPGRRSSNRASATRKKFVPSAGVIEGI
mmetsp:Transcript_32450/g.100409  ORF Transcript_32450/g.100409 Transcript_32450/m.100409 type:complete len:345 (-) Transcript_32450:46-1080(-)